VVVDWKLDDGSAVVAGSVVADVSGPLRSILTAERTALNFLCHLSGVATLARRYVDVVKAANPATRVLDTRKTTPGLRALEKAAVRAGGAQNHRGNLSEAVLVKDNHLGGLSIADAVARARQWWPGRMVEVECDRADQVTEAVDAGATAVLLDNMTPQRGGGVRGPRAGPPRRGRPRADRGVGRRHPGQRTALRAAGADLVSVGAITHSAPSSTSASISRRTDRALGHRRGQHRDGHRPLLDRSGDDLRPGRARRHRSRPSRPA
jgi:nicotinate-nucleotide pyrophosphorylase (carboxylating)